MLFVFRYFLKISWNTYIFQFIVALCVVLALETFVAIVAFNYDATTRSHRTLKLMREKLIVTDGELYFKKLEDHVSFNME